MNIPNPGEDDVSFDYDPMENRRKTLEKLETRARERIGQIKRELERDLVGRNAPGAVERRNLLDKLTLWAQTLGDIKAAREWMDKFSLK